MPLISDEFVCHVLLVGVHDRLYVCGINMEASNKDIEEVRSTFVLF